MSELITVKGVGKVYNKETVLEDISFTVSSGSILVVIGPNGAGKTTLVKILLGLEEPTQGEVLIAGQRPAAVRERIGYVPQRFSFDRTIPMTVQEFLLLAACEYHEHSKEDVVKQILVDVELPDVASQQIATLSGGQLQRVMIARAMMHDKDILVFDEPSAGVDVAAEKNIYDLITRLNKERGVTVLIISHELDVVFSYASSVLCLNKRLVCHGQPRQVITQEVLESMYGKRAGVYHHHC